MPNETFSRSLAAQKAALCAVTAATELGLIDGAIAVDPRLAETEKTLMLKIMTAVSEKSSKSGSDLTADEISSMFTFVYARAAEAVTNLANNQENQFSLIHNPFRYFVQKVDFFLL